MSLRRPYSRRAVSIGAVPTGSSQGGSSAGGSPTHCILAGPSVLVVGARRVFTTQFNRTADAR